MVLGIFLGTEVPIGFLIGSSTRNLVACWVPTSSDDFLSAHFCSFATSRLSSGLYAKGGEMTKGKVSGCNELTKPLVVEVVENPLASSNHGHQKYEDVSTIYFCCQLDI